MEKGGGGKYDEKGEGMDVAKRRKLDREDEGGEDRGEVNGVWLR